MTTVTKQQGEAVAQEILEAVTDILNRHGLTPPKIKWGYGDYFEFKVTASAVQAGPNGVNLATPEAQYYERFGWTYYPTAPDGTWLEPVKMTAPLGTLFTAGGKQYVFAGIETKRKKYPIVCTEVATGKTVFHTEAIVPLINATVAV